MATNRPDHLEWKGIVESRLKKLVKALEEVENSRYLRVRPFPTSF
jgi:poly(A) polymerase Pap1